MKRLFFIELFVEVLETIGCSSKNPDVLLG